MTGFGKVVSFKEVTASIEDRINHISKVVTTLQSDDLKGLLDKLRRLRLYVHDFEYWVDMQVRTQIENEAERKVKAMIEAGFSFNEVTVDMVRFIISDADEIRRGVPPPLDDDIPF